MGICWYCYWGWAKPVFDIYAAAQVKLVALNKDAMSALHYGPAHIVWEDENFELAEWCLENFDNHTGTLSKEELDIVRWSLEELAKIPLETRCPEPKDYDEEHPENYPPPKDVEMVRH